ncbi:MarR family winged helix-turn-helix transcriptional regulator [Georgenia sp. Z1491]|uniref:MarR family winged helix-turn-helix transcriptional regulator n=1 Tax=Georgenia sp. Z1491 TaxID=3416707 RepID=UPI003CF28A4C
MSEAEENHRALSGASGQGPGVAEDPSRWPTGRLLSSVARQAERELDERLAVFDLSHATMPVLAVLAPGPRSQRQTAQLVGVTEQTLARHLVTLERQGLLVRRADPHDGRRRVVALTPEGLGAIASVVESLSEPTPIEATLDAEEEAALRRLLLTMIRRTRGGT